MTRFPLKFKDEYLWLSSVIFVGFVLRLYSFHHSYALNQDGMLYIQQAKALHYGLYESLTKCYNYLNGLPVFISFSYRIFGDWLIAAKSVSLFFGTATMLPLYLLLRRFFVVEVACCALLVFAVNPIFVEMSSEVIRGPAYWFFLTLGMYLFALSDLNKPYTLPLSCISFMLACLFRFEGAIFLPVSLAFLLFFKKGKKWKEIALFLSPFIFLLILAISSLSLLHFDIKKWIYPRSVWEHFSRVVHTYPEIREGLEEIASSQTTFWRSHFLPKVKNLLWWLALGAVIVEIARAFFEPFFVLFLVGLKGAFRRVKQDKMMLYLVLFSIAAFLVLYFHVLSGWIMRKRFVALFLLPSFFVVGFGVEFLWTLLEKRFSLRKLHLLVLSALVIFAIGLPKILDGKREDSMVFQQIGKTVAARNKSSQIVNVGAAFDRDDIELVSFFGNLTVKEAPCVCDLAITINPANFLQKFNKLNKKIHYLVWDEKNWTTDSLYRLRSLKMEGVEEINEWQDGRFGRLVLFQIN